MDAKQLEDSFLQLLTKIKSNLDAMCDLVSPFTGNKHVVVSNGIKMCLDTGYRFDPQLQDNDLIDKLPDYIKNTSAFDAEGNVWFYSIINSDENFLLMPQKFDDEDPKKVSIWSLAVLQLLTDPTEEEMAGSMLLGDEWYAPKYSFFTNFTDAFIAYNIIRQNYSTPVDVN